MKDGLMMAFQDGGGLWDVVADSWADPNLRPVIIGAVAVGLVAGCVLVPLSRRLWLSIKPRNANTNRA